MTVSSGFNYNRRQACRFSAQWISQIKFFIFRSKRIDKRNVWAWKGLLRGSLPGQSWVSPAGSAGSAWGGAGAALGLVSWEDRLG